MVTDDESRNKKLKDFVKWITKGYKTTSPNFLKFKEDMRKTFSDPDMFNND